MATPQQVAVNYDMPDGTSGQIYFDASVNENHGVQAQVTDHQVETGPNVTDYIRPLPRQLSLDVVVTNTPIGEPPSQSRGVAARVVNKRLQFSGEFDRVRDVYDLLVDAAQAGAIFQIYTTLANYDNFAITNLSVPRNAQSGNSIQLTIQFQELRFVDSQTVAALPGISKTHKGAKPAKVVPDADPKATRAKTAAKAIRDSKAVTGALGALGL